MNVILVPFLTIINSVIGIYVSIVIASVVISWLVNFNVINSHNNFVIMVLEFLYRVTEPILSKIRRFLPAVGGLDLSPLVLLLFLWFLQDVIRQLISKIVMVGCV